MLPCVIFNPVARGEKARRFRRHLDEIGSHSVLKQTTGPEDARRLATQAVLEGCETVVAAGGDGTVNEVLNGIGDAPGGFERTRLGVLPLGTVNVFARELLLPNRLEQAWAVIQAGRERRIDLPNAEFSRDGRNSSRCFAQLAGAGLDARAVELVHWPLKKRFGPLAYVWAGLKALAADPCQIQVEAGSFSADAELVLIGNGKLYGGNYKLFPEADLQDGMLEVCVFPRVSWLTLAQCGPGLLLKGTVSARHVRLHRAESVSLTSSMRTPMEVDGEFVGVLPAKFTIRRQALRVVVPG